VAVLGHPIQGLRCEIIRWLIGQNRSFAPVTNCGMMQRHRQIEVLNDGFVEY